MFLRKNSVNRNERFDLKDCIWSKTRPAVNYQEPQKVCFFIQDKHKCNQSLVHQQWNDRSHKFQLKHNLISAYSQSPN